MASRKNWFFLTFLVLLYMAATAGIVPTAVSGWRYYTSPYADRPHLGQYGILRPAGSQGHGYGVVGSALLILLLLYSVRKRRRGLESLGSPAQWLNVHICFGIVGPLFITLHTSFKVQGLVAISYWSMIAVALSGVFGRWLYLQIPRNLAGQELSIGEINGLERDLAAQAATESRPRELARLDRRRRKLERNVRRLETIRRIFQWWHVIHKPFAIIMLVIMMVHVVVAVSLGYRWVF
jgi:hypothetical protein